MKGFRRSRLLEQVREKAKTQRRKAQFVEDTTSILIGMSAGLLIALGLWMAQ